MTDKTKDILQDIHWERIAQDEKWGEQNHPDGTGPRVVNPIVAFYMETRAKLARDICQHEHDHGRGTWQHILEEEVSEAFAEEEPEKLRNELIQIAAVAVAWVEAIDRRYLG